MKQENLNFFYNGKNLKQQDIVTQDFNIVEKSVDEKERSIKQFISTTSLDRGKDIMSPDGLVETNYRKNPVVLFNHNIDFIIGKNLWLKKEKDGVLAKTQFANTPFADDIYILNKEGCLNAWSIRFTPETWEFDQKSGITTYTLWELLEYSSVSIPMNQDAVNTAKSMIKSDEAKQLFKTIENKNEIEDALKLLASEIKILKDAQDELSKLVVEKDNLESLEDMENKFLNLSKEIEEIKKKLTKSVGTLDSKKLVDELIKEAIGEVS